MSTTLQASNLKINTKPKISNVVVANSNYVATGANTVSSSQGGYVIINGSNFTQNSQVLLKTGIASGSTLATSVGYVSSTQLRSQLPALAAGNYLLFAVSNVGIPSGTTITYQ